MNKKTSPSYQLRAVRVIYTVTTIFLVALSIYTFTKVKNLIDSSDSVQHTTEVNQALDQINLEIIDAESNKRAFLISGYSFLLEKRDEALSRLAGEQKKLDSLVRDNPDQVQNLERLNRAIEVKKMRLMDANDEKEVFTLTDSIRSSVAEGVKSMMMVKLCINTMRIMEKNLLEERTKEYTVLTLITPFYIIVLFIGALFVLFISYRRINSSLHESQLVQREILTLNKTFEFAEQIGKYGSYRYNYASQRIINSDNLFSLFGAEPQEFKEFEEFAKFIHPDDLDHFKKASAEAVNNQKITNWEYRAIRRDGQQIFIRSMGKIIVEDGVMWLIGTLQDITDEKAMRLSLSVKNDELETKYEELEKMNKELQLFAHISSHDLQEPLRKIQMFASRIVDKDFDTLSEGAKEHFKRLQAAAGRMQALIDDLLAFTQTTDEERKFESADIGAIVSEVLVEMKEIIDEKQAVIELTPHCQVRVIPLQFRQLMHNLINNALKFSIPGVAPYIRIDLQIEKGSVLNDSVAQRNASLLPHLEYCHITIEDNGVGFDQKYSEKIFEVFQRLHSREKYQGTGIGLAIVKKIVDNHKGIILATGTPNAGATFDIYIPTT